MSWDASRAPLYALGVGAGSVPGLDELAFVTENTAGVPCCTEWPAATPAGWRR